MAVQGKGCQSNIPRNFTAKRGYQRTSRPHPKGSHLEGETWVVGFMIQLAGPPLPTFRAPYSQEPKQEALLAMWSDCVWNCFRTRWKTLCLCMWGSSLPGPEPSPGVAGVARWIKVKALVSKHDGMGSNPRVASDSHRGTCACTYTKILYIHILYIHINTHLFNVIINFQKKNSQEGHLTSFLGYSVFISAAISTPAEPPPTTTMNSESWI